MNTSPFGSFKEYAAAKGAIYTFANNSNAIIVLLILSLLVFLALLVFSCLMKSRLTEHETPRPDLVAMSIALLTSFLPGLGDWQPPRPQASEGLAQGAIATVLASIGLGSAIKKRRRSRKHSRYL